VDTRPRFDRLAYREPRPSAPIIHALGWLNRAVILPRVLRLTTFDLPAADLARLRGAVRPGTAAFLAPNHPEFMTDWMIDKEISRRVSPLMAHWASYEVVNVSPAAQWLWLRNNLIANAPGGGGREYSVRWARAGHGVLLHPEGAPSWHGDHVGPLVPGAVQMAWETRRALDAAGPAAGATPVFVVPLVWKLHFTGDVSQAIAREIAHVLRAIGAERSRGGAPLEMQFADLQRAVLARSLAEHGGARSSTAAENVPSDDTFFDAQAAHAARLLDALESRHGQADGDLRRRLHGLRRAILASAASDAAAARRDRRTLLEIERLGHFTRERYGGPTLTQEQIAEGVKATRLALLAKGVREAIHGFLPVAVARRAVRVRVPEPIEIRDAPAPGEDGGPRLDAAVAELHARLQGALDALNRELAPRIDPYRRRNPFAGG
jgi:hypothetical protein